MVALDPNTSGLDPDEKLGVVNGAPGNMSDIIQAENFAARAIDSAPADFPTQLDRVIGRAQHSLLSLQNERGYWHAPLEANAQMNAEFIIFNRFMGVVDLELETKLKRLLLELQQPDGSWNLFAGGKGYLSSSIEAYFALKLAGMRAGDEPMAKARRWILARGGIAAAGTLPRFYLAAMGQVPWDATPAVPVELALLPDWSPGNVYELSSWARGTVFGLMLLQAMRPTVKVEYREGVLELYIQPPHFTKFATLRGRRLLSLRNALNIADKLLKFYDRHHLKGLRDRAIQRAESWILQRQDANGSWGGIEPCYLLSTMALKALGYRNEHPVVRKALEASRELIWDFGDKALCMPCVSPNWDSALAAKALLESDLSPRDESLAKVARWFLDNQVFRRGDWSVKRPDLEPGGWAFQFFNDHYPDVDDSAVILCVLASTAIGDREAKERAIRAGCNWVIGMQSRDGGFAAFDVDNDSHWLSQAPFADVEAVTDPSCPDLTGRVLEMMGALGYRAEHPTARRAIDWLKREQEIDGSWWGRWGVNYIYGTFSALAGLRAIGVDLNQEWIQRAVRWLKQRQNPDGGWGESCLSDKDPFWHGRGESTASQTAWALIGLLAGEDAISDNVRSGVRWLVERQNAFGAWDEQAFTGTGFPNHFYLRYYLYPHYFPLMALGRFRRRLAEMHS
jgi:squalene-hopene/tetraprenyl-beta-curcumene cyclase